MSLSALSIANLFEKYRGLFSSYNTNPFYTIFERGLSSTETHESHLTVLNKSFVASVISREEKAFTKTA